MKTNERLYDILTRHQIYLEGFKIYQARQFSFVLKELSDELKIALAGVKYQTIDGLTKAELAALLIRIRSLQNRVYSKYSEDIEKMLVAFMTADLALSKFAVKQAVFELSPLAEGEEPRKPDPVPAAPDVEDLPAEPHDNDTTPLFGFLALAGTAAGLNRLWSTIRNLPLPANGATPLEFLGASINSAKSAIESQIRKAYANRSTVAETVTDIVGTADVNYRDGILNRVYNQASAVTDTLIQHTSSAIHAAILSHYFNRYVWSSVIDSQTTDICLGRNGRIYAFGAGPLPPAHIRCRSKITPFVGKDTPPANYFAWMKAQPESVQADILGGTRADALRAGKLRAVDLPKFDDAKQLSLNQFSGKLKLILQS